MTEPVGSGELTQGIKDAQARFDEGMGAVGDASPYPMLAELRAQAAVHRGWPEMGIPPSPEGDQQVFSVYTFDAVKAVFTDNRTFSTRCYEAIVRPLQGPTILEMQEPEHALYRKLHEFAFARSSMRQWEAELVRPLVERTIEKLRGGKRADLVEEVFMPIPVRGDRGTDRTARHRYPRVSSACDRPAGISLRHGPRADGLRAAQGTLRRDPG